MLCSFDINLIEREISFVSQVQERGAKVIIGFSQDLRFLLGDGLLNSRGALYTDLCEQADVVSAGVNPSLGIYGRFHHKAIPLGEIIEDVNFHDSSIEKKYDFSACGAVSEYALAFQLEILLSVKEQYPDHRVACIISHGANELRQVLAKKYPKIEFPLDLQTNPNLLSYIKESKVFCNPELRPRPGRTSMEAYYCRVPFISSEFTYHSRICPDFTYDRMSITDIVDKYSLIVNSDREQVIKDMEERAKYDHFENAYGRIEKAFGWK